MRVMVALLAVVVAATVASQPPGWVGVYHAAGGTVKDGRNTLAFDVGNWGIVAPVNAPDDGGMAFKDDLEFHCRTRDINQLYGMLVAQSEGGTFSNSHDTDPWAPLNLSRACGSGAPPGPKGVGGLLQGAARWSYLARTYCPQISGVVIDDFWSNFREKPTAQNDFGADTFSSRTSVLRRPQAEQQMQHLGNCSTCPSDHPYLYGSDCSGWYCCPVTPDAHCTPPKGNGSDCCLWPGLGFGCQGVAECAGATNTSKPPCASGLPPGPAPPTAPPQRQNVTMMRDIKAALAGKTVLPDGTVDYNSPSLTPHLQLFVVTYDQDLPALNHSVLVEEGIIDGLSFWIGGPEQRHIHAQLSSLVWEARAMLPPNFPIFTGGYITYSSIGWTEPTPFYDMLEQSIDLYDANVIQGFYLFAGSVLHDMNSTLWSQWDIPGHLQQLYFPYLGGATVTVSDSNGSVANASVSVVFNGTTHVTRKVTSPEGMCKFGGWTGKARAAAHTATVVAHGYEEAIVDIQLSPGQHKSVNITLQRPLSK